MKYLVVITPRARSDINTNAIWWATHRSAAQARRWYQRILRQIGELASSPGACPLAAEQGVIPVPLFELRLGLRRRPTHRALFEIRDEMVLVLAVRHLAQYTLSPGDI